MVKNTKKYDYVIQGWPLGGKKGQNYVHVYIECPLAKKINKCLEGQDQKRQNINKRLYFYKMITDGVSVCIDEP